MTTTGKKMTTLSVRPVSERQARTMLMGMTMVPGLTLVVAPFIASFVFAWRSWWSRPYWFWRPFTLASLTIALIAALLWPTLYGHSVYTSLFGAPVDANVTTEERFLNAVLFATVRYVVWSISMLPHTLARIVSLLVERGRMKRCTLSTLRSDFRP